MQSSGFMSAATNREVWSYTAGEIVLLTVELEEAL
jgi:hypothetical protein